MNPLNEHVRHAFDCYCKKVLKFKARDCYAQLNRRNEHEISFSELSDRELTSLSATDRYFADDHVFSVNGENIDITDGELAEALNGLPKDRRDIILLSYFFDITDKEIGQRLSLVRRTVTYRRTSSLLELKKSMEEKFDE